MSQSADQVDVCPKGSAGTENQYDTCVVVAGPVGLAVVRALTERDRSYTYVEHHTGPGGLGDIDDPGSPMYESAHFISGKTLSGFV